MARFTGIIFLGLSLLLISSCKKTKDNINEATEFDINYSTTLPIPSTSVSVNVPADFTTPEISTESSSRFATEKTTKELVDEIKMTKFDISTSSGNLNFLKSLTIYIKSSGLADVAVATKTTIPQGVTAFSTDLSDANIKNYIFNDKIQFKVTVVVNTGLSSNQDLKMDQTVHVKGKKI